MPEEKQCPNPSRECPLGMTHAEFLKWKVEVDRSLDEQASTRQEFTQMVADTIDKIRAENATLNDEQKHQGKTLAKMLIMLQGWDRKHGILKDLTEQGDDIQNLKDWRIQQKAFVAGACAVAGLIGAAVALGIKALFKV